MAIRKIISPSNAILRKKARRVTSFTLDLQTLIDDMKETMYDAPGSGLAAPQVGQSLRIIIAHLNEDPQAEEFPDVPPAPGLGHLQVMVNPKVTRVSDEMVVGTEACLSIPGYAGDVERHWEIRIKYLDCDGNKRKLKTYGWLARVLQHECDHLDGILFIDRASKIWQVDPGDPGPSSTR